ncbi:Aste57867_20389 [Aphanomyces stellatus]|uniref:Aste57867_20389 protein n=1 Tax=Aphanomyces stellatus TaxID=120398 RepID=A0A485LG30_9STRA|nr:hypothetical protein As57867_020323 [Aphanomyces stellatus]VFT97075.1 Aste57867_20389 [Aphanomyces stellatus]
MLARLWPTQIRPNRCAGLLEAVVPAFFSDMADRSHRGGGGGRHGGGRGGRGGGGRGGFRGGRDGGGGRGGRGGRGRGGGRGDAPWFKGEGYNDGVASSVDEADVGIKVFRNDVRGFNGIVKQRYSDFVVREVAYGTNRVARLTELEMPKGKTKNRSIHTMLADAMESFLDLAFVKSTNGKEGAGGGPATDAPADLQTAINSLSKRLVDKYLATRSDAKSVQAKKRVKTLVAKVEAMYDADEAGALAAFLNDIENAEQDKTDSELVYHFQPCTSKEERTALHTLVREFGAELVVGDTVSKPTGEQIVRLRPLKVKGNKRKDVDQRGNKETPWPHNRPNYLKFILCKKNKETVDAMLHMSKILHLSPNTFNYAGTKDKRGLTSQWVTAYRVPRETVAKINQNKNFKDFDAYPFLVGNFEYVHDPLVLGDLEGNEFSMVLRNIPADVSDAEIDRAVDAWADHGFVNYFGLQRFGTKSIPSHTVGRALLRKDFKLAVDLILLPKAGDATKIKEARQHFQQYKDISAALRMFPPFLIAEMAVLEGFQRHGLDQYHRAVQNIPPKLRMIYTHAYQSYIWNEAASYRLSQFSSTAPVVGDMVVRGSVAQSVNVEELDESADAAAEDEPKKKRLRVLESDIVFITDDNIGEYTIEDVVLPVHGYSTLLPKNDVAKIYERCAKDDGVDFASLKRDQSPEYNLPGSYRHVVCKPKGVVHEIKRYNDETIPLVESDVDALMNRAVAVSLPDGKFRAICLTFQLQSSSYATIAIRELLKQSSSIHVQLQLNEQGAGQAIDTAKSKSTPKSIPIGRPGFSLSK